MSEKREVKSIASVQKEVTIKSFIKSAVFQRNLPKGDYK
jgi:hypothetical protein